MTNKLAQQRAAIEAFRSLHESGCFVMPNPWDAGSAVFLEQLGFVALATTSAGFAFTQALPDDPNVIPLALAIEHSRTIAAATRLPVNADFQAAYADKPEKVARNVAACVATGIAGLSVEDATGRPGAPLYDAELAVDRIRAAREAINATKLPVVLTARCEAWLVDHADPLPTAVDRLTAFAEAGADCLFAPGCEDPLAIAAIVQAVAPKPVNVLVSSANPSMSVARLAELGVRRISVGSALARAAWGGFARAAREIARDGTFQALDDAAPFTELNAAFTKS